MINSLTNSIKGMIESPKNRSSSKKKSTSKKTASKNKKETASKAVVSKKIVPGNPGTNLKVSKRANITKKEDLIIRRADKLPNYTDILTSENGEITLSEEQRVDYIVISSKEGGVNEAFILCSIEESFDKKVDHIFASLRQRCRGRGYSKISNFYVPRQLINLLYEKELKAIMSIEEEVRKSEGLQAQYDQLLLEALNKGVSDIHIEVRRSTAIVRFRVNGSLELMHDWGVSYARNMAVVIYQVIAEEKDVSFVETQQQSAIIDREIEGQRVRVRLNTMPAYPDGFDMVMRVLKMGASGHKKTLSELGYPKEQINDINISVSKPVGVTIIAGTTGSGKSTSLTTMINDKISHYTDKNGCRIKVITVEDPPEYQIDHATQCPVVRSRTKGDQNPFADAIKAAMRSDPDVLMVGEVRDEDSAELLVHAVQSGHQAFTTVHAPSAIGIVARLRSLGVPNDVLGSTDFLAGLIYQTLVPTVCPKCSMGINEVSKRKDSKTQELLSRIRMVSNTDEIENIRFTNTQGCDSCEKGITGRTVVSEIVVPDTEMINFFYEGRDTLAGQYFLNNGGRSALSYGIEKMKIGLCDPSDVEHRLGMLTLMTTINMHKENESESYKEDDFNNYDEDLESELFKDKEEKEGDIKHIDFNKNKK